jgi:LmbE family N-acetylglucosaminyl deacetylase
MRVLVVAAHPDDEVLGAGGTIARHVDAGDQVSVLICATGLASRGAMLQADLDKLRTSARTAAAVLGAEAPIFLDFPDNAMDSVPLLDVVKAVQDVVDRRRPETIYTHHAGDLNIDHGIVARAVVTAARSLPGHSYRSIYAFETLSSTEWAPAALTAPFAPSHFVDISAQLDRKTKAMKAYESELRDYPHPRSIEGIRALAGVRGSTAGFAAAEAFMVLRSFWS